MGPTSTVGPLAFWLVAGIAGTVGPIAFVGGTIDGSHREWWIGLGLRVAWSVTLGIDWLVVRRLRRTIPGWQPWQPPSWSR